MMDWVLVIPMGYLVTTGPFGHKGDRSAQGVEETVWRGWFSHNGFIAVTGHSGYQEYDWGDQRD
jgi:hypothetical protein